MNINSNITDSAIFRAERWLSGEANGDAHPFDLDGITSGDVESGVMDNFDVDACDALAEAVLLRDTLQSAFNSRKPSVIPPPVTPAADQAVGVKSVLASPVRSNRIHAAVGLTAAAALSLGLILLLASSGRTTGAERRLEVAKTAPTPRDTAAPREDLMVLVWESLVQDEEVLDGCCGNSDVDPSFAVEDDVPDWVLAAVQMSEEEAPEPPQADELGTL